MNVRKIRGSIIPFRKKNNNSGQRRRKNSFSPGNNLSYLSNIHAINVHYSSHNHLLNKLNNFVHVTFVTIYLSFFLNLE